MSANNEIVSTNFAIYLNNIYNFNTPLTEMNNMFEYVYNLVRQSIYISNDIKTKLDEYNKYPTRFKLIDSLDRINTKAITELSTDSILEADKYINSDLLAIRNCLDSMPETLDQLVFDINFQKTYLETSSQLYDYKKYFLNYFNFTKYDNFFYDLIGNSVINDDVSSIDFIQQFTNLLFLVYYLPKVSNIKKQLNDFLLAEDSFNLDNIYSHFSAAIQINTNQIQEELTLIILKNIYSMIEISDTVKQVSRNELNPILISLTDKFKTYINTKINDPTVEITNIITTALNHVMSIKTLTSVCNSDNNVITNKVSKFVNIEEQYLEQSYLKINEYNLRQYIIFAALYKFYPAKFVNILSIIMKRFTEDILIPESEHQTLFDNHDMKQELGYTPSGFNANSFEFDELDISGILSTYFTDEINQDNYLKIINDNLNGELINSIWKASNAGKFSVIIYLSNIFDGFIESNEFKEFLKDCLYQIYQNLYNNGYISHTFNWYQCIDPLKIYFKSMFRYFMTSNVLFQNLVDIVNNDIEQLLLNKRKDVTDEILEGRLDGANVTFYTRYQFEDDSIQIFINHLPVARDQYDTIGNSHTITFKNPPEGYTIYANYLTNYDLEFNATLSNFNAIAKTFTTSDTIISKVYQYVKNMYLSTVTKQSYYLILSNFIF